MWVRAFVVTKDASKHHKLVSHTIIGIVSICTCVLSDDT
jgi:hypothetical protein